MNPVIRENYETLLLAYAAGLLDQAQHFAVSVHLTLSPPARKFVRQCESIGGTLMECECEPAPMRDDSLHSVLARIDAPPLYPPASGGEDSASAESGGESAT